jgi:hypothetical protein
MVGTSVRLKNPRVFNRERRKKYHATLLSCFRGRDRDAGVSGAGDVVVGK